MPDFSKLRTLHDWIMDNVPPELFNLNCLWTDDDGGSGCALGWAPKVFGESTQQTPMSLLPPRDSSASITVADYVAWVAEAQQLFGLTEREAIELFRSRVPMLESKQHKQAWHARVQRFFAEHGEPLKQPKVLVCLPESPPVLHFDKLRFVEQREPELVD